MSDAPLLITVKELHQFTKAAEQLLGFKGRDQLVGYLAYNPEAGALIPGTGGVRKLRWAASGRGKRGGARVIYYFHSARLPLYAIDIYAKNEQSDLSESDKQILKGLVEQIKKENRL